MPGCAGEEAHEEVDDVVNQIEPDQRMDEVISHARAVGDEDAKVLEQDREFGDVDEGSVKSSFGIERLNFAVFSYQWRWRWRIRGLHEHPGTYRFNQYDIVRQNVPLMDAGAIFERHELEAEIANQAELVDDSAFYSYMKKTRWILKVRYLTHAT